MAGPTIAVVAPAAPADAAATTSTFKGPYQRISESPTGTDTDDYSHVPVLNGDGSVVVFASKATNLVPGPADAEYNMFLRDRASGTTEQIDVSSAGDPADLGLGPYLYERADVSDDGRFVAFSSRATNLVPGDTNGKSDVFLRDRTEHTTTRISTTAAGGQAGSMSMDPAISADGRYVAFSSGSSLTPDETDGFEDVFLKDTVTGAVTLVSVGLPGSASGPQITSDGRFVVFSSELRIYRRDLQTSTTTVVLAAPDGGPLDEGGYAGGVSDDGNRMIVLSRSTNIGPDDPVGADAYFVDVAAGTTRRLTEAVPNNGEVWSTAMSSDGWTVTYNQINRPFYIHRMDSDHITKLVPPSGSSLDLRHHEPALSGDGATVAFGTNDGRLNPGNTSGRIEIYAADLDPGADPTPPTVSCDPADGQWHGENVAVTCTASDGGSGLANAGDASFQLSTSVAAGSANGDAPTGTRNVCDVAGNCRTASSTGHKIDRADPTIAIDESSQGTFVQGADVAAAFSCGDGTGGSGLVSCTAEAAGEPVEAGDPLPTANLVDSTIEVEATDGAGRTGSDGAWFVVTDDVLTGTVARRSGTPVPDASVALWADGDDEPSVWTTTEADGTFRFSIADTGPGTFAIQVTKPDYHDAWAGGEDLASADPVVLGVRPASVDVTLTPVPPTDLDAPVLDCAGPPTSEVHDGNVTVLCSATDDVALADPADSGFALSTDVATGTETLAAMTPARVVCDTSENCATAGPFGPFDVDRKAPVVRIDFPSEGQTFPLGTTINGTDFLCTDLFLVSCTKSVSGTNLPATAGTHSFTVTGTDDAGHTTTVTRTYHVETTTLRGVVYGGNFGDIPQSGVLVELWAWSAPRTGPPTATATTTPNGSWSVAGMMPNAPYYVRYSKTGLVTAWHGGTATPETSHLIGGEVPISTVFTIALRTADTSGPTFACTPPSTSTWRSTAIVSVPCTASDPSGLAPGSAASFTLTAAGAAGQETSNASTNTRQVCDVYGNCASAGPFTGYKFDRKAPTYTCPTVTTNWTRTEQAHGCTSADGGIGGQQPTTFTLSTSVGSGSWSANASTHSTLLCDALNNCAPAQLTGLKVDRAIPTSTCPTPPTAWQNNNVAVNCTWTDPGSGYAGTPVVPAYTNIGPGQETAAAQATSPLVCDAVGNCIVKIIPGLKIDRKSPVVTCASPSTAWQSANQWVSCSQTDGGAGLAPGGPFWEFPPFGGSPGSFFAATDVAAGSESANAAATATPKCDLVNNCTFVAVPGNKIDRKAPTRVSCTTAPSTTPWYAANVTVGCTATDGGSGTDQTSYVASTSVAAGSETSAASMATTSVCDRVGNCGALAGVSAPGRSIARRPVRSATIIRLRDRCSIRTSRWPAPPPTAARDSPPPPRRPMR
ncbi:carboxypeptidase regulatory-like domain-containing protein [Aquihabitans daechungensis]|uniref:carboxypeptidase regulatory-like domain-containing protein n=1 Tax=Aquihabitans daechungensis TaxID=1052257 RepID=UPI003B9F048D